MLELSDDTLELLEQGATLVVPSRQRAVALQLAYATSQLDRNRSVWRSPDVLPWDSWVDRQVARGADNGEIPVRPLRAAEEWLLWREAVRQLTQSAEVAPSDWLTESLQRSARLLFDWQIPQKALLGAGSDESELLSRALDLVSAQCDQLRAAPSYRLTELLTGRPPRQPVILRGFSEPTRAQTALAERWGLRGLATNTVRGQPGQAFKLSAEDSVEEIALAAQWCRQRLATNPRSRLLVIIPDLAQRRHEVTTAFEQALAPRSVLRLDGEEHAPPFAVEGGQPLAHYPLVRQALTCLRLLTATIDFQQCSEWLRSAFWPEPTHADRARLDASLRRILGTDVSARELIIALQMVPASLAPAAERLRARIEAAQQMLLDHEERTAARTWCARFGSALAVLGWPGQRRLSSSLQQTRNRFLEVLEECSALGPGLGSLTAAETVRWISELANRTAFDPATGDAAITLTSALSDPVVRYDGIWITGLHADVWPRPVQINPFIPVAVQRKAGIPAANPARLLQQARELLRIWRHSTPQLIISAPKHSEDRDYILSPLVDELEDIQAWTPEEARPGLAKTLRGAKQLETFTDVGGEPWPTDRALPGGTRAIEYQNRCPFRAFAELRLGCVPLEAPRPGVDVRDRGRLLHRALEHLWDHLKGSAALHEMRGPRLDALIETCAARAVREILGETLNPNEQRAHVREERRTVRIVRELCELELKRPPFQVRAIEARRTVEIAGTKLEIRIDRIDTLEDGTRVIFDYKTGEPQSQSWLDERVSQVQLLVYSMAEQTDVAALATVHLTPSRVTYRGIADRKDRLHRVDALSDGSDASARQAWQAQTERWHAIVEGLARDFLKGMARRDPFDNACRTCHLHVFCRIADSVTTEGSSGDD